MTKSRDETNKSLEIKATIVELEAALTQSWYQSIAETIDLLFLLVIKECLHIAVRLLSESEFRKKVHAAAYK